VRREFIFQGDADCYKQAKDASDGFEHGYLGVDRLFELSQQARTKTATYVRTCLLELVGLHSDAKAKLLSQPFSEPLGHWPLIKYLRGTLQTDRDDLAALGNEYPFMHLIPEIKKCELTEDGKLQVQLGDKYTAELAEGVTFSPKGIALRRPR
jgi:hypothetical protein